MRVKRPTVRACLQRSAGLVLYRVEQHLHVHGAGEGQHGAVPQRRPAPIQLLLLHGAPLQLRENQMGERNSACGNQSGTPEACPPGLLTRALLACVKNVSADLASVINYQDPPLGSADTDHGLYLPIQTALTTSVQRISIHCADAVSEAKQTPQ